MQPHHSANELCLTLSELLTAARSFPGNAAGELVFEHAGEILLDGRTCALRDEVDHSKLPLGASPYTLEAEIMTTGDGSQGIIGFGEYGSPDGNSVNALRSAGRNTLYNYWWHYDITGKHRGFSPTKYHHVAATWDGTKRRLFFDYEQIALDTPKPPDVRLPKENFCVGMTNPGEYLRGRIRKIKVWTSARNAEEMKTGSTSTGTSTTTTTTPHPLLTSLGEQVSALEKAYRGANVTAELGAIKDTIGALSAEVLDQSNQIIELGARLDSAREEASASVAVELSTMKEDIQAIQTWQKLAPPPPPPDQQYSCDLPGTDCLPEIAGDLSTLRLSAREGAVVFESLKCPETDLCQLSNDVKEVLSKFKDISD